MRWVWVVLLAAVAVGVALAQDEAAGVAPQEAWRHKGETQNVCGQVVDTSWSTSLPNAPTYLYLERPRPEQVFTVVIPAARRDAFGESPEKSFLGKSLCVTGKIEPDRMDGAVDRKHRSIIVADDEEQITLR